MKRLELHLTKNLLIHNIVYIDKDDSIENEKQKVTAIIEQLYGGTYYSHNCNYEFQSLPIKRIVVGDEVQQLHNIIVNVLIPDSAYRDIHNSISYMPTNLNSTLIAHIEQWGNISYLYIIDFFRDGKYIHQGSINELSNYETMFQGFPKTYIPSINFYIVGTSKDKKTAMRDIFYTGNFNNCKIDMEVYDGLLEGMSHRPIEWFQTFSAYPCAFYISRDYHTVGDKIYGTIIQNSLVFTDNKIEDDDLISCLHYCPNILNNVHVIHLNKYHINTNLVSVIGETFRSWNTLVLLRVNQDKVKNIVMLGNIPRGAITTQYNGVCENRVFASWEYNNHKLNRTVQMIIPYKAGEDKHLKTLLFVNKLYEHSKLNTEEQTEAVSQLFGIYYSHYLKNLPLTEGQTIHDALVDWFEMCSSTAYDEQAQLKKAYINLKNNLEKEYKGAKIYLNKYDLSKKKAIPSLQLEESLTHRTEKQLSFNISRQTYRELNNMALSEPIICEDILIKTITKAPRTNNPILQTDNLNKFLDTKNNKICIDIQTIMKERRK